MSEAVAGVVVGGVAAAPAVATGGRAVLAAASETSISLYVRATTAIASAGTAINTAAAAVNNAAVSTYVKIATSPAISNAGNVIKGASSTSSSPPQNWAGIAGRAVRIVYEVVKRLMQ